MAFYNLLCCTTLSLADANVVQFYSCLNRCCRGLCWCPGTTSSLELGKLRAVRAIPSLQLSHGGDRKTGRVKPFVGAIFVTALNGLLMSDFPEKQIPSLYGNLGGTVHLRVYHRPRISGRIHILQNVSNLGSTEFQCCTSGYMRSTIKFTLFFSSMAQTTNSQYLIPGTEKSCCCTW